MGTQWTKAPPRRSGFYEVRMDALAWQLMPGSSPRGRLVHLDIETGRFDAGTFGGSIAEPLWEWRGPVEVPAALPGWVA